VSATRRSQLLWAAAIALACALTVTAGREGQRHAPLSEVPAADNPGPAGLEAAFRYLARTADARVLEQPFTALTSRDKVLITALPYRRPVADDERAALLAWVEAGGTLVVLGQHQRGLGGALTGVLDPIFVALHLDARSVGLAELGGDVASLLTAAEKPDAQVIIPGAPAMPSPLLAGVHALALGAGRGFDASSGPAVPLVVAGDTPVMLGLARGRGEIVVLAGPDALANARIDRGDNLQLLANLGARGRVRFDEGHHRAPDDLALASLARHLGPAALAALAVLAVLAAAGGRRLGPAWDGPRAAGPTHRDHAVQLGRLHRRAGAGSALAAELARDLRARARQRLHLMPSADEGEVLRRLSPTALARDYQSVCAALESSGGQAIRPAEFLALARDAAALAQQL